MPFYCVWTVYEEYSNISFLLCSNQVSLDAYNCLWSWMSNVFTFTNSQHVTSIKFSPSNCSLHMYWLPCVVPRKQNNSGVQVYYDKVSVSSWSAFQRLNLLQRSSQYPHKSKHTYKICSLGIIFNISTFHLQSVTIVALQNTVVFTFTQLVTQLKKWACQSDRIGYLLIRSSLLAMKQPVRRHVHINYRSDQRILAHKQKLWRF
jgi:hypothetical protein